MNLLELKKYCMGKKGTTYDFPFDEKTLVFRVGGKIYALTNIVNKDLTVNLKSNPEIALDLRKEYTEVVPGYHMNKKHWNTVDFAKDIKRDKLLWMVDHSYDLVFSRLKKLDKDKIIKGE